MTLADFAKPLIVSNYKAGTSLTITVNWYWYGSPSPDFTLKIYSMIKGV